MRLTGLHMFNSLNVYCLWVNRHCISKFMIFHNNHWREKGICCLVRDNVRGLNYFWLSVWSCRHFYIEIWININVIAAEKDNHSLKAVCKKCFDVKILRKQKTSKIFLCESISNLFKKINVKFHVYMTQTFKVMSNSLPLTEKFWFQKCLRYISMSSERFWKIGSLITT